MGKNSAFGVALLIFSCSLLSAAPSETQGTVKLVPKIREKSLTAAELIPIESIRSYLQTSLILDNQNQFFSAPYIMSLGGNHVEGGTGMDVYVRGLGNTEEVGHTIYSEGKSYTDPVTGELLGFEAFAVGTAELVALGDPAQFKVGSALAPIYAGMRLFPSFATVLPPSYLYRPPAHPVGEGYILSSREGLEQLGPHHVVVISLGQRDGLEEGNYLDIYQPGDRVVDTIGKGWRKQMVQLPDKKVGRLMVFQVYEKLSVALLLEATDIIHLLDKVKSP